MEGGLDLGSAPTVSILEMLWVGKKAALAVETFLGVTAARGWG